MLLKFVEFKKGLNLMTKINHYLEMKYKMDDFPCKLSNFKVRL